jgi:hypothetical protein
MLIISKAIKKFQTAKSLFDLSHADKRFCDFSKKKWKYNLTRDPRGEVITDILFYDLHIFQLSYIANYFKSNYDLQPKYYHIIHREKILLRVCFNFFRKYTRIHKLFLSFGSEFAFGQKKFKKSKKIVKNLKFKSKLQLLNYEIEDIKIGDLIYDAYLRTYSLPTVDLSDKRLYQMVLNSLDVYFSCKDYLDNHDVKKIVLSHAVYINYGILARVALHRNIDVYNVVWERVLHKLSIDHVLPTLRHYLYPEIFDKLSTSDKELARNEARVILNSRLQGNIDRGIAYMKQSPYSKVSSQKSIFRNNGNPKVVLMLHCFYDAPHIFRNMLFEDFYEWLDFTLSTVDQTNLDLVVKPHPNGKPYNENIIRDFQNRYPNIKFIDKNTSNNQLVSEKLSAVLSVYGSIAHEFAYLGVPVLLAGDNPTSAYDFCYEAKSKKEYEYLLKNINEIKLKLDLNKSNIEEFFYMNYLHIHMGRVDGNNDVFYVRKRDYSLANKNIFSELIEDSINGELDNVFPALRKALKQLEEF